MIWGQPETIKGRKGGEEEDVTMQHESKMKSKEKDHFRLLPLKQLWYMKE